MTKKETYCNLCGSLFGFWDENEGYSIHKRCGFGSKNDGLMMTLDICIKCMDNITDQCVINPLELDIECGDIEEVFNEN